jgi:hypothetical protein
VLLLLKVLMRLIESCDFNLIRQMGRLWCLLLCKKHWLGFSFHNFWYFTLNLGSTLWKRGLMRKNSVGTVFD